jgi:hypothetical protein
VFLELNFTLVPSRYDKRISGGNGGPQITYYEATYFMGYSFGLGYRYQPIEGGFYFHGHALLNKNEYFSINGHEFDIWFGLGLGYCFK